MDRDKIKNFLYLFGKVIGFLGLAYVIYKITQEYTIESFFSKIKELKLVIFYSLILNLISSFIGIYGWHKIMKNYSKIDLSFITSFYYYAKTDISKYLPGNIFHLLSRQVLASKIGISQKDMAKGALLHTIMLLVATVLSSTIFALLSSDVHSYIKYIMLLSSVLIIGIMFFIYPKFNNLLKVECNLIFLISIAMHGVIFALIIYYQVDNMSLSLYFKVASIYILSWLIGFVTPGASGGLGVREAAFLAIAKFVNLNIQMDVILFSILLIRFINIIGDILVFLLTLFIKRRVKDI